MIAAPIAANAPIKATMKGTPIYFILFEGFPGKNGSEKAFVGEREAEDDASDDVVDGDDDEHGGELEVEELERDVVDGVVEDGELVDDGVSGLVVVCLTAITATPLFFILFEGFPEEFGFEEASVGEGEGETDVSEDAVDDDDDELNEELEVEELEGDVVDDELIDDGGGGLVVICMTGVKVGLNV